MLPELFTFFLVLLFFFPEDDVLLWYENLAPYANIYLWTNFVCHILFCLSYFLHKHIL